MKVIKKISIGNLFKMCGVDNSKYYEAQQSIYSNYYIKVNTPDGFKPIKGYVKKNNIPTYKVYINDCIVIGADKHRIKIDDQWRFLDSFSNKEFIGYNDLYDIALDDPHEYITTNGIVHHNTTIAKALCKQMGLHYQYINVSSESGIDTLRSQIKTFATIKTLDGKPKVVIMDEFDGATPQLQNGLRAFIEEFHKSCRFIFTCNFISKIIKPLQEGRVMVFNFDMSSIEVQKEMKPKVYKRVIEILDIEGIEYDKAVLAKIVDTYYPNIRMILSLLQKYSAMNGMIDANIFNVEKIDTEFYDLILSKKFEQSRKYVIERSLNYDELFSKLYNGLIPLLDSSIKPQAIILIADYQYRHSFSIDPEINFSALLIELMALL